MGSANSFNDAESVNGHGDFKSTVANGQPSIFQDEHYAMVDLMRRPVDKSKTGTWRAAPFLNVINIADFNAVIGLAVNLVPYLAGTMHQSISNSATIVTDFLGTAYLTAVLGGFLADSYLGSFYTLCLGAISVILGLGVLVLSTAWSNLQPAPCSLAGPCQPAGGKYMAPFYVALYTIAVGTGLVKPNNVSMGGDQYDNSSPTERKQSINFFLWFYFCTNIGLLLAFTLGVYLQDNVSRSWGYGFSLMLYGVCFLFFILGATKFRHKIPSGSFLTRSAHVLVASVRNFNTPIPAESLLYNPAPTDSKLSGKLKHTTNLRFLDKAAIMTLADERIFAVGQRPSPWKLCSVTQVEESKRLIQLVPIWATIAAETLVFSQLATFTVQQGQTLDRRLGPHFVIPAASLGLMMPVCALILVPVYDWILVPIIQRYTKNPYGFPPLQRLGASLAFSILTVVCAALVERKRLTYVRDAHLQALPLGAYDLPMSFWYLLPQFFCSAQVELFLYVASYQFFYHESAETTRSVGSSFTYSAAAMGYFFSTIIVNITNSVTRHEQGGSWLNGQLNNGGLEKFYWLLAVLLGVDFLLFLICAHFYTYKHDWWGRSSSLGMEDTDLRNTSGRRVGVAPD